MSEVLRAAIAAEGGLATQSDLARLWGISEARVRHMRIAGGFPEPVTSVTDGRSPLWTVSSALAYRPLKQAA
jgi:hypothetical protein